MPILYTLGAMRTVGLLLYAPSLRTHVVEAVAVSVCFALLAWRLKAATPAAAASGGVICLCLVYETHVYMASGVHSALVPLIALFALTFIATRAGRNRKAASGLAEGRSGRTASQVVANLGFAALFAFPLGFISLFVVPRSTVRMSSVVIFVCVTSALAEAAADTVSSEIGQAFGGSPRPLPAPPPADAAADTVSSEIGQAFGGSPILLTTLRPVPPGTDGAISLRGTLAGIFAAAIVAAAGRWSMHLSLRQSSIALVAGICGLFFDSLLGATLERRGWIGNDLVNFCSTAFSAALCLIVLWLVPSLGPRPCVRY